MQIIRFLVRYWRGEIELPLLMTILLAACLAFPFFHADSTLMIRYSRAAVMLLLSGWLSIGALRCADKILQERPGSLSVWAIYGILLMLWVLTVAQVASLFLPASDVLVLDEHKPPKVVRDGADVRVSGDIDYRTLTELRVFLNSDNPPVVAWLQSTGGNVIAGRSIGLAIERAGMDTAVDGKCYSACTLAFAGGVQRLLSEGAALGFHGYRFDMPMRVQTLSRDEIEAKDRVFLVRRGVTANFLDRVYRVPPEEIWIPTRAELLAAGMIRP